MSWLPWPRLMTPPRGTPVPAVDALVFIVLVLALVLAKAPAFQ